MFTTNRLIRLLTDLLNEGFQSIVWQAGLSSPYSCGGLQHRPFLTLSMPSGKELTASFPLHTPLMYLPNEQFAHPGPLRADSQLISLHLSSPVIKEGKVTNSSLGAWDGFVMELSLFENVWTRRQIISTKLILDL